MKITTSLLPITLLASAAAAISMDVQQNSQWNPLTVQLDECKDFDIGVTQVNLDPGSNNQRAFRCIFYGGSDCQGSLIAVVASNHPLSGVFNPAAFSMTCLSI
ncbi:hypothetical protein BJX64DRAFT_251992 [Aspergillus heterothallicus]